MNIVFLFVLTIAPVAHDTVVVKKVHLLVFCSDVKIAEMYWNIKDESLCMQAINKALVLS